MHTLTVLICYVSKDSDGFYVDKAQEKHAGWAPGVAMWPVMSPEVVQVPACTLCGWRCQERGVHAGP